MISLRIRTILGEIKQVLQQIDENQAKDLIAEILSARTIVTLGAGRVGMAARGFAMRLGHLGLKAYTLGDSSLPAIGKTDLLIVCSGSGETKTIYDLVISAKRGRARIAAITSNPLSKIGKKANVIVILKTPTKLDKNRKLMTQQPMTTLNEQCLQIFFDALVLELMSKLQETNGSMWARHSHLE